MNNNMSKEKGLKHKILVRKILINIVNKFQFFILEYYKDKRIINIIKIISKNKDFTMRPNEFYNLYSFTKESSKLNGEIAEVGVYNGCSSKIICEANNNKKIYLFDTFEGIPEKSKMDNKFNIGDYKDSLENVKEYLKEYKNVNIFKGIFPKETSNKIKDERFCFVHLDLDIYKSTYESLKFFYPRMVDGGIIMSHDYSSIPSIKKAFKKYFGDKKRIYELSESQCFVIKEGGV